MIRRFSGLIALVLLVSPSLAQEAVALKFKFPNDQKATATAQIESKQTLTIAGMPLETGSTQERTVSTVNGTRAADGRLRVEGKMEALKASLKLPGGIELEFDSAKPDAPPPGTQVDFLLDLFKAESKATWTTIHGADNRVLAVEGREKALEGLPEQLQVLGKKQYEQAYLVATANREMEKIPTQPIKKGDTWERTEPVRLEAGQTMTFKTQYQYDGVVEKNGKRLHQISSKPLSVEYAMDADSPSPLKLVASNLKIGDANGVILFDQEAGRIAEETSKVQIKGDITFEVNGMQLPSQLDLTLAVSSTAR